MFVPRPFRPFWQPNSPTPNTLHQDVTQLERLTQKLDAAEKKIDKYAQLIASLSAELKGYQAIVCLTCKEKIFRAGLPTTTPAGFAQSASGFQPITTPSIVLSGPDGITASLQDPGSTASTVQMATETSLPVDSSLGADDRISQPPRVYSTPGNNQVSSIAGTATRRDPRTAAMSPYPYSAVTNSRMSSTQPKREQSDYSVEYNPEIKKTLSLQMADTFKFAWRVYCTKFSPDGKFLAVGLETGQTHIYDMTTRSKSVLIEGSAVFSNQASVTPADIWGVRFSPDNKFITTGGSNGLINVWEIGRRRIRATFKHSDLVRCIDLSPDGHFLVSASYDRSVCIWRVRDGSKIRSWHDSANFMAVGFSPDGQFVAAGTDHSVLNIWHVRTGSLVIKYKVGGSGIATLRSTVFTSDGNRIASGGNSVQCWDVSWLRYMIKGSDTANQLLPVWEFNGHQDFITAVSFSSDNRWVASSSYDHDVCISDARSGDWVCTLKGHRQRIMGADFSPDGHCLSTGGRDRLVRLWRYNDLP